MNNLQLNFSDSDLVEIGGLPTAVRTEVESWLRALATVAKPIQRSLERIAQQMGVSAKTARRKYDDLRRALAVTPSPRHSDTPAPWRVLINGTKHPKGPAGTARGLDPEFVEWFRALCESNQRKSRPAHRVFVAKWLAGEQIPGLDNSLSRHRVPRGCKYANLQRLYSSTSLELAAMRNGRSATLPYRPKTYSTRVGLWVGSQYMFDDLWHDNFTVFKSQVVRPLEFDALDLFSGCKFAWGCQPRIRNEDGTMENLKEKQMRMLLASCMFNEGYSPRGTELLAEHGAAAIAERIEKILFDRTGGLVKTRRSGITDVEQAVAGMFQGRGKGNPRFKAHLESLRNLIHNELGALPAQTGKDTDVRPERLHGELTYTSHLLKVAQLLSPDRRKLLRLPLLDYYGHFLPLLMDVYRAINSRTWHALEGWSECGHTTIDYRLSPETDQWLTTDQFLQLPDTTRALLLSTISGPDTPALRHTDTPQYFRQRQLSPLEVWNAGRSELKPIPAFVVSEILGEDFAREERIKGAYFEFADSEIAPELLRFESRALTPEGREIELRDGETYKVFVNPFNLEQLFVHDAAGRHVGVARRDHRVSRLDTDALKSKWGRVAKRETDLMAPLLKRHSAWTRDQIEMRENNARVLDTTRALTDAEKSNARQIRREGPSAADDILAVPHGTPVGTRSTDNELSVSSVVPFASPTSDPSDQSDQSDKTSADDLLNAITQ